MKKTTGKVVSLVLALALVVTSFSANFAFAATKYETGTATAANDDIYFAAGTKIATDLGLTVPDPATMETYDHTAVTDYEFLSFKRVDGKDLIDAKKGTDDDYHLVLKSTSATGTEKIAITYQGTTSRDGVTVNVRATANVTIHVAEKGSYLVSKTTATDNTTLNAKYSAPDAIGTYAVNDVDTHDISVYLVGEASDGTATYTAQVLNDDASPATVPAQVALSIKDKTAASGVYTGKYFTLTTPAANSTPAYSAVLKTNASLTSGVYTLASTGSETLVANPAVVGEDDVKQTLTVASKLAAPTGFDYVYKYSGKTILTKVAPDSDGKLPTGTTPFVLNKEYFVATAYGIDTFDGDAAFDIASGTIGDVTVNGATAVTVEKGSIGNITTDAAGATIVVSGGTVGTLKSKTAATSPAIDVTVSGATKAAGIDAAGKVSIESGTVTKDVVAADATITSFHDDDNTYTTVIGGKVDAPVINITSDDDSSTKVAGALIGAVTLGGKNTTVGSVDGDYQYDLALEDFEGTIAKIVNVSNITADDDTVATINGTVKTGEINLDGGSLTVADVNADDISGTGTLTFPAGKLFVNNSISNDTELKLTGDIKVGTVAFSASSDMVDPSELNTLGYTVKTVATSSDKDNFVIKSVDFAGLDFGKTSAKIAKGYTQTFTVANYPTGTALPADTKIAFDFDGSDEIFETSQTATTFTIKVKDYNADFSGDNEATLTATVVDANGDEYDADLKTATVDVTAIAVPEVTSDTNNDFSVAAGASYTFKITSATAPTFGTGTAGVFTVAPVTVSGNNYYYKITAVGKVGAATGIYLNGTKLLVATVKGVPFTSDTNKDLTVKGAYTVKITSATVPTFGVGTAGVVNAAFVTKTGNDYFYKLTSVGAVGTKAGVFVNGVKIFVATVG